MKHIQDRLTALRKYLADEEIAPDREQVYIDDLKQSIERCEKQLKLGGRFPAGVDYTVMNFNGRKSA